MQVPGSLLERIRQLSRTKEHRVGMLVVDMETPCGEVGVNIRRVLTMTQTLALPVWLIETGQRTIPFLTELLPSDTPRIQKNYFNAFAGTDLKRSIDERGCTTLVVMGATANICVMNTIIGGLEFTDWTTHPGAVELGYRVLTSQHVISGEVGWKDEPGVDFYTML